MKRTFTLFALGMFIQVAYAQVAPTILTVAPASGAVGTSVAIAGTGFSPAAASNIVYFGAVKAAVSSANPTNLAVTVPSGATFGPVTVTAGGLTAYSGQLFEPTFAGDGSSVSTTNFAAGFNINTPGGPGSMVIADLDGDGKPDVAFVTDANVVCILQNIGTNGQPLSAASFGPLIQLQFPPNGTSGSAYRLRAVDLDADGRLDLIAGEVNGNRVSVFHNLASPGTLTTNSFAPPFALIAGSDCRFATAADLYGDGRVDIVALNYGDKTISIFKNIGTAGTLNSGSFASPVTIAAPGGPYELTIADLDGDGKPDLAAADSDSTSLALFRNQTSTGVINSNSFAAPVFLPSGLNPQTVVAVDLDGDGRLDLVSGSVQSDDVNVYRNLSTPGTLTTNYFAPEVDFGTPGWMHTISVADFNGDGKPDLAVVGELNSFMAIFQNNASPGSFTAGSFAPRVDFGTGWNAWGIASGDIDGDGRPDVVFCNYYDHNIEFYQNLTPFTPAPVAPTITLQPTNITVTVNTAATFAVAATGTPTPSYQWSFDGTNILGETNAVLTLSNVLASQAGTYAVLVSNPSGSVPSSNAVLTVYVPPLPPVITGQTPSQVALVGNNVSYSVTAIGDSLNYFWRRNGVLIPNATNTSYTLANVQLTDSGSKFTCLVTNASGFALSTNASLKVINTISNDLCSGAVIISSSSYTNQQSTANASSYGDPLPDCLDSFGNGVWYVYTVPADGMLYVDTFGSDFDTGLAAYTGTCDSLTEVACDDDTLGVTSQVVIPASAGTTYYLLAGGYGGHVGDLVFHLNFYTPPVFTLQPTNTAVVVSSNATFCAAATGSLPMSFQWYFNGTPLSDDGRVTGSATTLLSISNVLTSDAGNYQLVASNPAGTTNSAVAVLTPIILPPTFIQLPASQNVGQGSNVTFTTVVDGTPPFSYRWSFNGTPLVDDGVRIVGATTPTLTISNLTASDAGGYYVTVTNSAGYAIGSGTLVVLLPPAITQQLVGRSVPPGLPTTFPANSTGVPAPTFQWLLNGTNIPGAFLPNYTVNAVTTNSLGLYQFSASNLMGVTNSNPALLTFGPVAAWGSSFAGESWPPPGLSNVISLAGSIQAGYAVRSDGTVVSWGGTGTNLFNKMTGVVAISVSGNGTYGSALRSDGTLASVGSLRPPATLTNVVALATGDSNFGLALRAEGTVIGWGQPPFSTVPAGLNHVTAIASGYNHSLALRSDGTVVAWGAGPGTNVPTGLSNVKAIAAGYLRSLAVKTDGTVVSWGTGTGTNLPAGLTNLVAISARDGKGSYSLALRADGTVVGWGDNLYGETNPPAALNNLTSVAVVAGGNHGLALVNDGSPQFLQPPVGFTGYLNRDYVLNATVAGAPPLSYQWLLNGTNIPGATNLSLPLPGIQLTGAGNYQLFVSNSVNTAISLPAAVAVVPSTALTFLSLPNVSGTNVYQGGTVNFSSGTVLGAGPLRYQWYFSTTNIGATNPFKPVPGATNDSFSLNPALAVQSGYYYVTISNLVTGLASTPTNVRVQFARAWGYLAVSNPPVNVTNAVAVACGGYSTFYNDYFVVGADGKVRSWANYQPFYGETNVSALSNSFVTAIAAGSQTALALKSNGTVYAWGNDLYGQTNVPASATNVAAIAIGGYHDLALRSDGTVVGWGANAGQAPNYGQSTNNPAATNVVAIAAGSLHSLALRADHTIVAWGLTGAGVPPSASNVVAIAAGSEFSVALRADGTLVQWGNGPGIFPLNLSNIVAISIGGTHGTAIRNNGTVVEWGSEYNGTASNNIPADLSNVVAVSSAPSVDFGLLGTLAPTFTVQPWNQTIIYNSTAVALLAGKCEGVQPVTYHWLLNGTNVPGATNDMLYLNQRLVTGAPVPFQPGDYQLVASNAFGVTYSKPAKVTVVIPLGVALEAPAFNWTTAGNSPWYGETNVTHDGVDAVHSGSISGLEQSILQTVLVTNLAGSVTFWWKVSSEAYFDTLSFNVNGTTLGSISGNIDWQFASFQIPTGTNVLQWIYAKDASVDAGLDAGFVDQFGYLPAPQIMVQPANVTASAGAAVSLSVVAAGIPTIGYQWQQNGNPVGNNSPVLTLNSLCASQNGIYTVTVTNSGGMVTSSNAVVRVKAPQQLGSPTLLPNRSIQFTSQDADGGTLTPSDLTNFEAQASSDLINWTTLPNALTISNGELELQDPASTSYPARYYRIVEH